MGGTIWRSPDGGQTWSHLTGADGYCTGQCDYDEAIAADPNNASTLVVGGTSNYGGAVLLRSVDGGAQFSNVAYNGTQIHSDTHSVRFAMSNSNTVYVGTDGGVWKSGDNAVNWTDENTNGLSITQFESIATHPSDRNLSLGGTQDNGTERIDAGVGVPAWTQVAGGDGGFALIDQSSASTSSVRMYHTFAATPPSTPPTPAPPGRPPSRNRAGIRRTSIRRWHSVRAPQTPSITEPTTSTDRQTVACRRPGWPVHSAKSTVSQSLRRMI